MTIEEKVQAVLIAASGVTTLVPAARIGVPSDQQNQTRPYIVHFPVGAEPVYLHGSRASLTSWGYQVSIFADSYSGARAASDAVIAALNGTQGEATFFWRDQTTQFEEDVRVHHIAVTFDVHEAL